MRQSIKLLAAVSRGQPSRLKKPALGLDEVGVFTPLRTSYLLNAPKTQFIRRQRVLRLWRDIVRALNSEFLFL